MRVDKRRRREHKTDYHKRMNALKSGRPRITFRRSNQYIIAQYISSSQAQDKVEFGVSSRDLLKYGWPQEKKGSLKSIPASYLTGFLIGKRAVQKEGSPIVDFGLQRVLHKTKTYAFLKGLIDAGMQVPAEEELFPSEDRLNGKHLKNDFSRSFEEIKSDIEKNA